MTDHYEQYMNSLFPNIETRKKVDEFIENCLLGKRVRKLYVFVGGGNNGKTTFVNMLKKVFGANLIKASPNTSLDSSRKETRLVVFEDCEMNDKIVTYVTKDGFSLGKFLGVDVDFPISFNTLYVCNGIPKNLAVDTIIIPFTETFDGKDKPDLDKIVEHFKDFEDFGVEFSSTAVCIMNGKITNLSHHSYT